MNCFTCQAECAQGASFCSGCGRSLSPKENSSSSSPGSRKTRMEGGYPHSETFDAMVALRKKRLRHIFILFCLAAATAAAVAIIYGAIAAAFVIVPALGFGFWLHRMSSGDYYSLPHARDASGNHRCIYCGNKGIYRKGQYRINNTYSSCSKCRKYLFTE